MEGVKEFLESSSIDGLVHISTNRRFARILWIFVVFTGFIGAGVLINQSFSTWRASPVSTTIETLSISDLDFPNVTVCPPRNSLTSLNPILVMARNTSLDKNQLLELRNFAEDSALEVNYKAKLLEFTAFTSAHKILDWYTGVTQFHFPYLHNNKRQFELDTTSYSGTFTTPYFQQTFEEQNFDLKLLVKLRLHVPEDIRDRMRTDWISIQLRINYDIENNNQYGRPSRWNLLQTLYN